MSLALLPLLLAAPQGAGWDTHLDLYGTTVDLSFFANWIGDVDQDGVNDFGLWRSGSAGQEGLYVHSGIDGKLLYTVLDSANPNQYHGFLKPFVDVNRDGYPEFVLYSVSGHEEWVFAYSGLDGAVVWSIFDPGSLFGTDVENIPDRNGDGIEDLALCDPSSSRFPTEPGYVHLVSGASGIVFHSYTQGIGGQAFGNGVAVLDDLDGDGQPELVTNDETLTGLTLLWSNGLVSPLWVQVPPWVVAVYEPDTGDFNGDGVLDLAVRAVDSRTGQRGLAVLEAPTFSLAGLFRSEIDWGNYADGFQWTGDVDGDGCDDLILQGRDPLQHYSWLDLVSGSTLTPLAYLGKQSTLWGFPGNWSFGEDGSGDGRPDLIVSMPLYANYATGQFSWIRILEAPRFVHLQVSALAAGQPASAQVTGGDAGAPVWLLASKTASLTTLPIGWQLLLAMPITVLSSGVTDPAGTWTFQGTIPATAPIGATFYFEAVATDAAGQPLVSNVIARRIQ